LSFPAKADNPPEFTSSVSLGDDTGIDMKRIATALGILLLASSPGRADDPFEPTASERGTIDKCLKRTANESVLKQASTCIGLISDPCIDKDTATAVGCQERETRIWDDLLNKAFQDARAHLDSAAGGALKDAQHAWIAFRDAKCAVSEKEYEGGTMATIMVADCKRTETGRRALEMQAIAAEAEATIFAPR
jgi:uncharacterized protein YecT (DUF1311 family)